MSDLFSSDSTAIFSPCRQYRYDLSRTWDSELPYLAVIGLNPSTADERINDPTIRRCIGFAHTWGYGGLHMLNLFGFRATKPADMIAQVDPVGPENDAYVRQVTARAGLVLAAWGAHGAHRKRDEAVLKMLKGVHYLRLTKEGHPGHPLYLPANLWPIAWDDSE